MAKKNEAKLHMWLGKHPLLSPEDENWVETQAAVHEFGESKLPRDEAEGRAYRDYQNRHSAMAAAHHLVGQRSTVGEESQKHALMYALHLKSMGYDPSGPVPDAVKAYMNSDEFEHPMKFKAHKGDALLIHSAEPKDHDRFGKSEDSLIDRLQHLKSVVGLAIAVEKIGNAIVVSEGSRLERLHKAVSYAVTLDKLCKAFDLGKGERPFRSAAFRHKPSGDVVETGAYHNIDPWLLGGSVNGKYDTFPGNSSDWEAGFVTQDGRFFNRVDAARHINMSPKFNRITNQEDMRLDSAYDEAGLRKMFDVQPGAKRLPQGNCRQCGENIVAKRQQLRDQGKIQLFVHNNFCSTDCEDAFIAKRFVKPKPSA